MSHMIKPVMLSTIEQGHRRPVTDLVWLNPAFDVASRSGNLVPTQTPGYANQFATIASDGMLLFWDLRNMKDDKV
jgi:hypothetical protein